MIYGIDEKGEIAATCGIVVNNEYILWSAWDDGSLYRLYLKDNHNELVKSISEIGYERKTFGCMLEYNEKIYLISIYGCYEIVEYDMRKDRLKILYRKTQENVQVFSSFLINGKIYIFPMRLDDKVCIYSIRDECARYIMWKELFPEVNINWENNTVCGMDCFGQTIYGTIQNTPYLFRINTEPDIVCEMQKLKDGYKASSINVYGETKYITLTEGNKLICLNRNGETQELEIFPEINVYDGIPYICSVQYGEKIFLFPFLGGRKIQLINGNSGEKRYLEYPEKFLSKNTQWRLFWKPVIYEKKIYLLPFNGNGLLILDMCSCKIEYYAGWRKGLKSYLEKVCCNNIQDRNEGIENIGKVIHNNLKRNLI